MHAKKFRDGAVCYFPTRRECTLAERKDASVYGGVRVQRYAKTVAFEQQYSPRVVVQSMYGENYLNVTT